MDLNGQITEHKKINFIGVGDLKFLILIQIVILIYLYIPQFLVNAIESNKNGPHVTLGYLSLNSNTNKLFKVPLK